MVQDRAIFTTADQQKVANDLSNGAICNDLERPLTWFSRSRHSLTLNISQTATDTAIFTIECEFIVRLLQCGTGHGHIGTLHCL